MTAHNGCSPVTTVELLKHWQRATAKLQNDLRTSGGFETRSSELVAKTLANVRQKTEAALDHDDAQAVVKPPCPIEPADKKLAADWYTWGFQAGLEAEKRGAARDAIKAGPVVSSTDSREPGMLRHHANETLEEQEFLLKQSALSSTHQSSCPRGIGDEPCPGHDGKPLCAQGEGK